MTLLYFIKSVLGRCLMLMSIFFTQSWIWHWSLHGCRVAPEVSLSSGDHQLKVTFPFFPHTCSSQHTLSKCKSTYTVAPQNGFFQLIQCYPEFDICLWQIFTTFSEMCNWFVIRALLKVWWAKEKSRLMGTGVYGYRSFEIWSFPEPLGPQLPWTKSMCLLGLKAPLWHQRAPRQN